MTLLHGFGDSAPYRGGYVAIGNFDGVHRGHQRMIATLTGRAQADGVPAVVLTFNPHPIELLRPGQMPPRLSNIQRKAELLTHYGVDTVIAYPTDQELLSLSPEDFFSRIVETELDARGLVEGPNFFFGRDRKGDVHTLRELCEASGRSLDIVEPVLDDDQMVSSSRIRKLLVAGDVAEAVEMLGHPYRMEGRVVKGAGRGRTLGWPTANLAEIETLYPADGVYAGIARVGEDAYPAAIHLGSNPTFQENTRKLEVHLIGFQGDLYDRVMAVDLLGRVRGTQTFAGPEELRDQLKKDIAQTQSMAERYLSR
ncbi:bifunctional riboflavin kinase/FAD synthetase [Thalassoroseus pseudoceratinae]|uniref:bifunctional riboflavin kinase/FAD synthetase n=1 Tax=Thalassoroseus pseudoceratinae TaxID=2713176 RepID=UPI0014222B30|nr:bifunctional riboflavin kinase/FAD synthetase [Thalassoroseus pseudoceratinae]